MNQQNFSVINSDNNNMISGQQPARKTYTLKPLSELTLLDRFLFDEVMSKPEASRDLISIVLDKEISSINIGLPEKNLEPYYDSRAVRLDLLSFDEDNTVYDAEAQHKNTGYRSLCRRSRYYQAHIDVNLLKKGDVDFSKLNDVYIIFIAPFDLFGKGRFKYTFHMVCDDEPDIRLDDGATRIFLNTQGKDSSHVSLELIELLHFIEKGHLSEKGADFERIHRIAETVNSVKSDHEVGVKYMRQWEEIAYARIDGHDEGLIEGRAEGRAEGQMIMLISQIRGNLSRGYTEDQITNMLMQDIKDVQRISDYLKMYPDLNDSEIYEQLQLKQV